MYLSIAKTTVLISIICIVDGFRFYGLGTGYRYIKKKLASAAMFDLSDVETKWIAQPLDHFDAKENRTWNMRYFENLKYWKPNGSIFFFIGGEGEAHPGFLTTGTMFELAKETKGAMFGSEHRYYGKSMPLPNTVTENMKFLSSRQALADLAKLIESVKLSSPEFESAKVVVVGGSYPGNLAAWLKLLYPTMIDAAISSSAPVLAKKDFYEYIETVSQDYEELGPPGCWDKTSGIFQRYQRLFRNDEGIDQLKREENICADNDMTLPENRQLFFMDKISVFMSNSQYGTPNTIEKHCKKLMNSSRIISSKQIIDDEPSYWREETGCFDYDFYNMIDEMKEIDWISSWIYQTCTEFGYYQTTNSGYHPFTQNVPTELYYKMCTGMFGPDFDEKRIDEGVRFTNDLYQGLQLNVSQVVFVNGDMDPWSRLGVLEDLSYDAPAKVIPRASHCRDLFSNRKGDPEELKESRDYVKYLIKKWLGAGEYNN